jgi:hypothetical protein
MAVKLCNCAVCRRARACSTSSEKNGVTNKEVYFRVVCKMAPN